MKEKFYSNFVKYFLYFVLFILFISSILFTYGIFDSYDVSNILVVFGIISFIGYIIYKLIYKDVQIWELFVILISFLLFLSYCYAYDQRIALRGFFHGREGIFVIISYYLIFLLSTTIKDKKINNVIFNILTITGLLNVIYAILQVFNVSNFVGIKIIDFNDYSTGFLLNSNFFGTLMTLMVGLWLPKYFFEDFEKFSIKYFLVLLIFIMGLFFSGAMSAFVALIVMFFMSFVYYFLKRKQYNLKKVLIKYIVIFLGIGAVFAFTNSFVGSILSSDVSELFFQASEGIKGNVDESFGTGRIYIWSKALSAFKDYIWHGIGIDNFAYITNKTGEFIIDPILDVIVYKAHNEYLQILITQGIFQFIVYLIFIVLILIKSLFNILKSKNIDITYLAFFFSICGYLVQAFFNIRITLIAPVFFILCGILVSKYYKQ